MMVMFDFLLLTWCNYYSTSRQNGFSTNKDLFESSSVVVSAYCQLDMLTLVSESETTASNASTGDK